MATDVVIVLFRLVLIFPLGVLLPLLLYLRGMRLQER
jgi:hypothetical protein